MKATLCGVAVSAALLLMLACSGADGPTSSATRAGAVDESSQLDIGYDDALDKHGPAMEFADSEVFFEFNSTDDDLGLQLFLDAVGWERIKVWDPERRGVIDFEARGRLRQLGLTELRFESAEPSPAEVLALFPEGEYRFRGRAVDGTRLIGEGELSHALPEAPIITPSQGESVPVANLGIQWQSIAGLAGFQVIVVDEDSDRAMEIDLPAEATSVIVPAAFLVPGTEYKVEVLSIAENGNKTISEGTFFTLP